MNTKQHQRHKERLDELVLSMLYYVAEYVDDKLDSRSSSTLLNYVHDYKMFFEWLMMCAFFNGFITSFYNKKLNNKEAILILLKDRKGLPISKNLVFLPKLNGFIISMHL